MPVEFIVTLRPGKRIETFVTSRSNYFLLEGGTKLPLIFQAVWCKACKNVREGEVIATVEQIDNRIRDLERFAAEIRAEIKPHPQAPTEELPAAAIKEILCSLLYSSRS